MHYYKRNIGDYAKKAARLTMLQHGAYTLLIDSCYDREEFPTLEQAIDWCWASTQEEVDAVTFVLNKFFHNENGVFVQKRIKQELTQYHKNAETNKRIAMQREAKRRENSTNRAQSVDEHKTVCDEATPNQEPLTINQEPLTNTVQESKIPPCPHSEIINLYHNVLPELPKVLESRWSGSAREKDLRARWKEDGRHQDLNFWNALFNSVRSSQFHMGANDRGWQADLGWILKRANFDKMLNILVGGA